MERQKPPGSLSYFLVPSLVLLAGLATTLLVTVLFLQGAEARDRERLRLEADLAVSALEERVEAHGALLRGMAGLFAGSDAVDADEFRAYVGQLGLGTRYPGVLGIGYAARTQGEAGRAALEANMRAQGFADFRIWPAGPRPVYTAIAYIEPMNARNAAALGFDMFTEARRREAMQRTAVTGQIAATGKVELVQEIDRHKQPGFLMYLAVRPGGDRQPPVGFVYSPLRAGDLLQTVFPARQGRDLDVAIHDGSPEPANLLYRTGEAASGAMSAVRRVIIGGRVWTLTLTTRPAFAAGSSRVLALWSGLAGAAVTLALTLAVMAQARGAMEAERARAELRAVNASLEDRVEARTQELRGEMSRREAAEAQVRQMQKMEAIGQLTGGIAHDFNNMLAIVIGSLDMARRRMTGELEPRVRTYLDNAADGAQRAAQLTSRLLAFARRQQLRPEALEPNKLITGMIELLRRALGERIVVKTDFAPDAWAVHADAAELENALLNLAVNARDAMPDGGRVSISVANVPADAAPEGVEGDHVAIRVRDAGVGMTPEVMERAFEPFFTTKQVGRGTGLGLSQVYGFVRQSGGQVTVDSAPGEGATVTILLPRWAGAMPREAKPSEPPPIQPARAGETVLVVEDEAEVRRVSVEALRDLGYAVVEAADAAQALSTLPGLARADLLFTDVVMPGLNGFQLAERARALRPDLKVLYTTGYSRDADAEQVAAGMILAKPFAVDQLARKVREALDSPARAA